MSELWYTEKQTKNFGITLKVNKTLHTEQTEFQHLEMVETEEFGNMLFLDGMVMTSEKDEFVYHEMVAHVPLFTHPNPEHVLVVGGGDGGVIREILKHPSVKKATLVDIDGKVIEYSKSSFLLSQANWTIRALTFRWMTDLCTLRNLKINMT